MDIIATTNAPGAIGPYSQAAATAGLLFTSGQIPINPKTGAVVEGGIVEQSAMVLENLKAVVLAGGSDMEHVLKTTCFLSDMGDFAAFNEVYARYFKTFPARSCVAVKTLPKNVLVEVECVAERI